MDDNKLIKNSKRDENIRAPYLSPEKPICNQVATITIRHGPISEFGKEYIKAVYCQSAYLTFMHSTSCEMPGWMNHKLESRFPGEISTTSNMQMIPL